MTIDSFFSCNGKDDKTLVRPMAVAGSFYPADKKSIQAMAETFFKPYEKKKEFDNVNAIIVPHAGYVFSGHTAASAIAQINPDKKYDHIFLIGPSHREYIDGASIDCEFEYYDTPLGKVKVDKELCRKLVNKSQCFTYRPVAHNREHCIEVQLPLLKYYLKDMPSIVPIIVGTESLHLLKEIAEALEPYFNGNNLFVISSDFSHYPNYNDANMVDKHTGDAIMKGDPKDFIEAIIENSHKYISNLSTSACGQSAIGILLYLVSQQNNIKVNHIDYCNSGDSYYGDKDKVVGYHSFTFTRPEGVTANEFKLTEVEKKNLLKIARNAIKNRMNGINLPLCDPVEITSALKMRGGAFVTLTCKDKLRGCIGHFGCDYPLYKIVEEMAQAAAFEDPRFYPLHPSEMDDTKIEISVLSPMKRIHSIDEFKMGKHGIYIEKDGKTGTFLPQVANEVNWTEEEFLGHCARDKAGISWDGWKDANLYVYEVIILKE